MNSQCHQIGVGIGLLILVTTYIHDLYFVQCDQVYKPYFSLTILTCKALRILLFPDQTDKINRLQIDLSISCALVHALWLMIPFKGHKSSSILKIVILFGYTIYLFLLMQYYTLMPDPYINVFLCISKKNRFRNSFLQSILL